MENAHSIIRSKTSDSDTIEQMQQKAKGSFQSKAAQHSFKSYFSPPSSFTFSANQLKYLKMKCPALISSIFIKIAQNPGKGEFRGKGKNLRVVLPRIFGPDPVKTKILPLGYCSEIKPDPDKICDMPGCTVTNDAEWVLLEGCSHSFHLTCLSEIQHCPLCQKFVQQKADSQGTTAKNAILNPKNRNTEKNKGSDSVTPQDESNLLDTSKEPTCNVPNSEIKDLDANITYLINQISTLSPIAPPSQRKHSKQQQPTTVTKPPHCKKCGHLVKGHKRPKGNQVKCEQCPGGICTSTDADRRNCNCEWHSTDTSQQLHSITNQQVLQTPTNQLALHVTLHGSVKEWLLPPQICQSMIFGVRIGSNACTIIATIGASKFLSGELIIPTKDENVLRTVSAFAGIIKCGNIMYRQINLSPSQVNLDVREAIATRSDQFSLMITEDIGIFSTEFLQSKMQEIVQISEDTCTILIVPPDKSILICFDHTKRIMALFESHKHQGYGGLIAVGCYDDIRRFIMYIEHMVARDWQTRIPGTNMTVLKTRSVNL